MSSTLTFTQALMQAEAQARSTLAPELHERLSAAVALVQAGAGPPDRRPYHLAGGVEFSPRRRAPRQRPVPLRGCPLPRQGRAVQA